MQKTLQLLGIGINKLQIIERVLQRVVNPELAITPISMSDQTYIHHLETDRLHLDWRIERIGRSVHAAQRLVASVSLRFLDAPGTVVGMRFDCANKTWYSFVEMNGISNKATPKAQTFIENFPMSTVFEPKALNQPMKDLRAQRVIRLLAVEYKRRAQQAERAALPAISHPTTLS